MKTQFQYIFFLLLSVFTFGQVNIIADADKKTLNGREQFVVTVIQEINGNDLIQETPLRTPDLLTKFNIIAQGSTQRTFVEPGTKTVINQLVYEFLLEPKQSGKHKIGSFLVTVNGKIYMTDPFDITVREGDFNKKAIAENTAGDVYLNLEVEENSIYKNQPTLAVVRVYSKDFNNLRRVGKVNFSEQNNVNITPVSFAKSEIEQNSKSNMSSQVIAVAMIIPNEAGNIELNPASVSYNEAGNRSENLKSNAVKLNVKKLPSGSPNNYRNAVGKFDVDIVNKETADRIEINKPINITLKMKGVGNMNSVHLPKIIESESYTVYKPEISKNIHSTKDGIAGEITANYVLIPRKPGVITINSEAFSFFDPKKQQYVDLGSKALMLSVFTPEQIADAKSTIERVNDLTNNVLETVHTPILETKQFKVENKRKINWKTLVGNYSLIALFLGLLVFFVSNIKKLKPLKPQAEHVSLGSVAETEAAIKAKQSVDTDSSLLYLEKLVNEEKYTEFFENFETLNAEVLRFVQTNHHQNIKQYLEQNKGQAMSEEYRTLVQKIHVEKYSPVHSPEIMNTILSEVKSLFSQII